MSEISLGVPFIKSIGDSINTDYIEKGNTVTMTLEELVNKCLEVTHEK
jgi:hypothetical protein